ncbi:vacuolar protein sorting-associated protein 54 [Cydia splendana]|uniref:vacuolar protein sorting-associated protein 54 n=1 Tax=Cydia splendana TaxID=1100963 RepID=UPI002131CCD5
MEDNITLCKKTPTWQNCVHCPNLLFSTTTEFERHIQDRHSIKEGSIILCQYGPNGICASLQFGDLRKAGFKYHVREYHLFAKDEVEDDWTFYSSSQNLPAVLNDPNRGKQSNFFTKIWGDGFVDKVDIQPSPYVPEITLLHFEAYCKRIVRRHRRHCKLKENLAVKVKTPVVETNCEVPEIFYEQTFELHDPNVFSKVFPNLVDSQDPSAAVRSLQETLSTYLDFIEMKISKQVAQKSDAFFHAMLSHDTIMEQMARAVKTVRSTRNNIHAVKTNLTENPLKLVSLTRINQNLNNVHELLKLIGTVQQTQPMIQLLLSTSDYVAALDLISSTQKVLSTQLARIQAFRHLSPQLTEMKRLIHKMLSNEFQRFIVTDLNRPPKDLTDIPERDKIVSIVSGILRLKEFDFIETFKMEAMTTIQATIKQCVIEIVSERDGNTEVVLRGSNADNTSLMCNESIVFLQKVTPNLITLFKRILCLRDLVIEISQMDDVTGNESEEMWTPEELLSVEEKLDKMIVSLSDYSNERCANLIVTKSDKDFVFSDLTQLSKLSTLIENFSDELEKMTGHNSNSMKLALRSFAMKYIQNLHSDRRSQLTITLNAERWKSADVPVELQQLIDKISNSNDISTKLYETIKSDGKFLVINKEIYAVVGTVQLLIKILLEYCDATKQSPVIVQYLVHCMLELTRLFNSRCCQLVLGAGAIQSAGLKTISTSNLALVSRSLQVLLWLLPIIKEQLSQLQSKEVSMTGFDSIQNDIVSHKQEIENKICLIVSNMLCSQLTGWDAKPPVPSQTFRNISKHLVKLHEALIDILPIEQIRNIYKRVHDNFKDKLREQLAKMNIVANGSPQHGVVTSELTFYLQTLKTLRVINENDVEDNILYDIWLN